MNKSGHLINLYTSTTTFNKNCVCVKNCRKEYINLSRLAPLAFDNYAIKHISLSLCKEEQSPSGRGQFDSLSFYKDLATELTPEIFVFILVVAGGKWMVSNFNLAIDD